MLFVVSPAKTLDFESASLVDEYTQPEFLDDAEVLISELKIKDADYVSNLMSVSEKIATLNVARFNEWSRPFNIQNAKQAVYAFKGDVYTGLSVETMTTEQVDYLQCNLRILSGLYGLLKPLDLMQAYRLEMGTKFPNSRGKNLYEFWGEKITSALINDLADEAILVNLASNEYFKAVKPKLLNSQIITPVFKDEKNGKYKIVSFYAKKARGLMMRFAADNNVKDVEDLKRFDYAGYSFSAEESTVDEWIFKRSEAVAKSLS